MSHKSVFGDVQEVNIHEAKKIAILNHLQSQLTACFTKKGRSNTKFISYKITRASQNPGPVGFSVLSLLGDPPDMVLDY